MARWPNRPQPEYGVEKLLRSAEPTRIYEGTNQINRFEIMEAVMEAVGARAEIEAVDEPTLAR